MKVTDYPPLELEIPVGLMPLLLVRTGLPLSEIQKVLGVSDQAFHEFCNGRGRLSPMKAGRMASLAKLEPRELTWVAEAARTWRAEVRPKEGACLTHPFRGEAKVRRLDQGTVDLLLMPKERPMNGVPLLVFETGFIDAALAAFPDATSVPEAETTDTDVGQGESSQGTRREAADVHTVSQAEIDALFARSGLDHIDLAKLIGISPSVISAHSEGRTPMRRARFQRLEAALAKLPSKSPRATTQQGSVKKTGTKDVPPRSPEPAGSEGYAPREEVVKTIRTSGLSHAQIGALLGISDSMVGHYMTGRNKMSEKRYAYLLEMLKNRHVHAGSDTAPPMSADQSSAVALENALSKEQPTELPAPPAEIFVTGLSVHAVEDRTPSVQKATQTSDPAKAAPPRAAEVPPEPKSSALAMLEMLDLVQTSLAELFGGRELLAQRMAVLDHLPEANAGPVLDAGLLSEIRAAQAIFDARLSGLESQMGSLRSEVGDIAEVLKRLDDRIASPPAPAGCSVTRLARLLAAG